MNNLKPLITLIVLGGIGYVVYNQLNSKPPTPPPGAPANWDSAPMVQMPGEGGTDAKWGGLGGGMLPPAAIGAPGGSAAPAAEASVAPTFSGTPSSGSPNNEAAAPRFGSTANYDSASPTETPAEQGSADEKWGTTDPAAAVGSETAPPTANYGDAPTYGSAAGAETPAADTATAATGGDAYAPAAGQEVGKEFQTAWQAGNRLLEEGKLAEGLAELSKWYEHPQLSATESQQLTELLDQVAGTVIYSTQHTLEPAYIVKEGEKLEDIARQHDVPWQLIAKINGIDDPATLQSGEQLKVIRGPFSAQIQLEQKQLTLMLNGMYAGRFAVGLGRDMPPRVGSFSVTEKVVNPVYHGHERTIDADDPANPLGERWLALGTDIGIHGMGPLTDIGSTNQPGSISMGPRDVEDVFDILSEGSKVIIVR